MDKKTHLANSLREARKLAGHTVDTAGTAIGRSGKTISAWEAGINEPSPEMLIKICQVYKVPISFFFPPEVTDSELTNDERELLAIFREMDTPHQKAAINTLAGFLFVQNREGK